MFSVVLLTCRQMPTVTLTPVVKEIRTSQYGAFVGLVEDQVNYLQLKEAAVKELPLAFVQSI